jgi:hypothetical protein
MSPSEKFAHRLLIQAISPGLDLPPARLSQKFVHHLILDEVRKVRCDCPSCYSRRFVPENHARALNCLRLERCLELVRQHEALIEAAYPESAAPALGGPLPAKEVP